MNTAGYNRYARLSIVDTRRFGAHRTDTAVRWRRRLQVTSILATVDLAGLRRLAAEHTRAVLDDADGRPVDLMAQVGGQDRAVGTSM
ncbi:hypothetical protein [Kibdelosporangium aridum]|uniref:hypothetical protein n=1 Tax=Kibdelosporangium aridum TaxID=2030 RepID=UPI0009FD0EDD|nr:hypothetical protein [Kibdelosporangium aridum]